MKRPLKNAVVIILGLFLAAYGVAAVKKVAVINQAKCLKCGTCVKVCPAKIPQKTEANGKITSVVIDPKKCLGCGTCFKKCPAKAISMVDPAELSGTPTPPAGTGSKPAAPAGGK
jgi:Pyruvate/2-oxoacid:ferredoxin oxidoreductase delta subunit